MIGAIFMTTRNVPQHFADFLEEFGRFREENARQHGELAGEMRMLKFIGGALVSLAIAVAIRVWFFPSAM